MLYNEGKDELVDKPKIRSAEEYVRLYCLVFTYVLKLLSPGSHVIVCFASCH